MYGPGSCGTDKSGYATKAGENICKFFVIGMTYIGTGFLYGIGAASAALMVARAAGLIE